MEEAEGLQGQAPTAQKMTVLGTSIVPFHIDTLQGLPGRLGEEQGGFSPLRCKGCAQGSVGTVAAHPSVNKFVLLLL